MVNSNYYSQSALWGKEPERYQIQARVDILSMIPVDAYQNGILDIGCGDGFITNEIPVNFNVIGMDISPEALRYVKRKKIMASVGSLPFSDGYFSLVMANDVIEHLPDTIYGKAISEIFRVAGKYVLLTVPYGEQLEKSFAECSACGHIYHINHHYRAFLEKDLESLCPEGWDICEIRYSGDFTRPPFDPTGGIRNEFRIYNNFTNCVCPQCGGTSTTFSHNKHLVQNVLKKVFAERIFSVDLASLHPNRTEIIVLFYRKSLGISAISYTSGHITVNKSILEADLENNFQMRNGFTEGFFWTSFSKNDNDKSFTINFPILSKKGDVIEIEAIDEIKKGDFAVYAYDPLLNRSFIIPCTAIMNTLAVFKVDAGWNPSIFGTTIQVFLNGCVSLKRVKYINSKGDSSVPLIVLKNGHNVLADSSGKYLRSWGLWVDRSGLFPSPVWLWNGALDSHSNESKISSIGFIDEIQKYFDESNNYLEKLSLLVESKERARESAEKAYQSALQEISELNLLVESKERDRKNAERAFYQIRNRKVNRVLVISHLFPNENQKNLGCFVAEQVEALREYENLDCRVISCQPFWHNSKNPMKLPGCFRRYREELHSSSWFQHNGIPTLFLPFLVGYPYFTYRFYFLTYYFSIASLIEQVYKDFKFDLIHAHTGYLDGFSGMRLAKKYNVPLVITEHTGPFSLLTEKKITRKATVSSFCHANKIICVSKALENEVKKWVPQEHHHKFIVLPNVVDLKLFHPSEKNVDRRSQLKLLSVISLDDNKNPFCLLEAFKILHSSKLDFTLKIIGDGPLRDKLNEWITNNGFKDRVEILGWKTREEVAHYMRSECDIFVHPSRSETFGVVVAEALACGKPVISTKCGGPESIITSNFLGEFCGNNEPISMAEKIAKVSANLSDYKPEKIFEYASNNFGTEKVAKLLCKLYQEI